MSEPFEIPRCRHGKILLGCPDEFCPEQQEYLGHQNATVHEFLDRQREQARLFVREYLGLPPEVIVPKSVFDESYERISNVEEDEVESR